MNEEGRCPLCKTGVVKPAGRMVETHIAGITVRDGGGVVDTCSACGESFFKIAFSAGVAGASTRAYTGAPSASASSR